MLLLHRNLSNAVVALILCLLLLSPIALLAQFPSKSKSAASRRMNNGESTFKEPVIDVVYENFSAFIKNRPVLLEFYAPWCHHCTQFSPLLYTIAETLDFEASSKNQKPIQVGKVNVAESKDLAAQFGIESIPSLFLIKGSKVYQYDGPLMVDSVVEWCLTGYKTQSPISYFDSPLGLFAQLKGAVVSLTMKLYNVVPNIASHYNITPFMSVMVVVCGLAGGILLLTFMFIFISVSDHAKSD